MLKNLILKLEARYGGIITANTNGVVGTTPKLLNMSSRRERHQGLQ